MRGPRFEGGRPTRDEFGDRVARREPGPGASVRIRVRIGVRGQSERPRQEVVETNPKSPNIALDGGALREYGSVQGVADMPRLQGDAVRDAEHRRASIDRLLQFDDGVHSLGEMLGSRCNLVGMAGKGVVDSEGHGSGLWAAASEDRFKQRTSSGNIGFSPPNRERIDSPRESSKLGRGSP